MSANAVIVVDSSDEDEDETELPVAGGRSAPLRVSSSDDDSDARPSQAKKPRVELPVVAASSSAPKARKGLNYSSSSDDELESTDELEDSDEKQTPAPVVPSKKSLKQKRKISVEHSDASAHSDDDQMDEATSLRFRRRDGRMYSDALSFSELQAQQREFERLHAQAHRKHSTTSPRSARPVAHSTARQSVATGTKRKASDAALKEHSTQHSTSKGSVMKKTASPSPFDSDFRGPSDDSFSSGPDENRASVVGACAKPISLKVVVAQERELARLRQKNTQNSPAVTPKKAKKEKQKTVFSIGTQSNDNLIDGTEWASSVSSDGDNDDDDVEEYKPKSLAQPKLPSEGLISETDDQAESEDEYIPSKSRDPVKPPVQHTSSSTGGGKSKGGSRASKKNTAGEKDIEGWQQKECKHFSAFVSEVWLTAPPPVLAVTDLLAKPRDATNTVVPSTEWRNLCVDEAPPNLLSVDPGVALPFHSEFDRPLLTYDVDGDLMSKCKLLSHFGKSMQFMASELVNDKPEQAVPQEDMDNRVTEIIQRELPRIRACHQRKTSAIITEGRAKVKAYLAAHVQRSVPTLHNKRLVEVSTLDKSLLNRMKQEKPTQGLSLGYTNVWGETIAVGERLFPADVNQLPAIRPLSRSTAFVGLKANFRVEDDPILRYMPYFGDNDDGRDIDVAWYDGIGSKDSKVSSGSDGEVNEYLLRLVLRECGTSEHVFTALKKVPGFAQAYSDYSELKKLDESVRLAARRIKEAKELITKNPEQFPLAKVATLEPLLGDPKDSEKTLAGRFAPPPTFFDSNLARCYADRGYGLGLRPAKDYTELLVTYRDMFCRMCYVYHCVEHGIQHPLPSHRVDPINPPLHLSPVALAAKARQEEHNVNADPSYQTPESNNPTESPPSAPGSSNSTADDNNKLSDSLSHSEGVRTDEDVTAEHGSSEACYETATDDDVPAASESHDTRRSSRSATRISTLASRSLKKQATYPSRRKPSRTHRVKIYPKVADESEYLDDSHHAWVKATVKKSFAADQRCSDECTKAGPLGTSVPCDGAPSESMDTMRLLSDTELVLLRKLRSIIGDNPCLISTMVKSTTCKEVGAFLESERKNKPIRTSSMDDVVLSPDARSGHNGRKRGRAHTSRSSSNRILLNRTRNNRLKEKGANHEYEPCEHDGICDTMGCSCMSRDHTCEKACSCSRDCPNRFPGCKCTLGNCRTKACPCFVAARECDPDLCHTCGASEVPALIFDEERRNMSALDLGICCNVNILRGLHKKVGVAYSTTHGWGAFALEPIKRGEFIYEYHGALLSQDEAERRGSIYDKMTISFLFDADDDTVVDAIRKGNKSKFANHLAVGQKCRGKVLTVGGEHRISIWAQQDIEKGEELFFDYGYHGETAPDWSQLRIKGSARQKLKKTDDQVKKEEH